MKVLYINPVFLGYRIPFYKYLNELFHGTFFVLYSPKRYIKEGANNLLPQIKEALGNNAIELKKEYIFDTKTRSFTKYDIEKGRKVPFTFGLLKTISRIHPDVLISEGFYQWTPLAVVYSFLRHSKLFIGYERTPHTERNTGWLMTKYRQFIDLFVSGYLVNGSETKRYLLSIGINSEKIFIGGMSADGENLRNAISKYPLDDRLILKSKFAKQANGILFLFSGKITERKGLFYLLNAWKNHTLNYTYDRLIVIGGGSLLEQYKNEFRELKTVFFEGKIPYNQTYKYYAIADVFILPTLEDNWSLVIPEAMSCGLPVATSIYNGCHVELVKKNVNGITFDTYSKESILSALEYFHHADLKVLGLNSIKLEKEFDTEHCATRTFNAICKVENNK